MVVLKLKTDRDFKEYFNTAEEAKKYAEEYLKNNEEWKKGIIEEYGYSDSIDSFFEIKE